MTIKEDLQKLIDILHKRYDQTTDWSDNIDTGIALEGEQIARGLEQLLEKYFPENENENGT